MIAVQGVSKLLGKKELFCDVSFHIRPGERIGLIGPNGAGKTTLFHIMMGEMEPDSGAVSKPKAMRLGYLPQEWTPIADKTVLVYAMDVHEELNAVQVELRFLQESFAEDAGEDAAAELARRQSYLLEKVEHLGGYDLEARACRILAGLGFGNEQLSRPVSALSGGWAMRLELARLLLSEPDLMLLDEPTNHLDLDSLLWLEEYLLNSSSAVVLVSHDRAFLNRVVTRILELEQARLQDYSGNYDAYLEEKALRRQVHEASFKNQQERIRQMERFIERNRVRKDRARQAQSRLRQLEKIERIEAPVQDAKIHFNFPEPPGSGKRTMELRQVRKVYGGNPPRPPFDKGGREVAFDKRGSEGAFDKRGSEGAFDKRGSEGAFDKRGSEGAFDKRGSEGVVDKRGREVADSGGSELTPCGGRDSGLCGESESGETVVYDGIDLVIERGDHIAFLGRNGAGKSTLLKMLAGTQPVSGGERRVGHGVVLGYYAQYQWELLRSEWTVIEEASSVAGDMTQTQLRGMLGAFLFSGDDVQKKVSVLSGGEKARLILCKLLLQRPNFLLLDEPTNHLDIASREVLERALEGFPGTLCFISHDRHFINRVATKVLVVDSGQIHLFPGNYTDYEEIWKKRLEPPPTDESEAAGEDRPGEIGALRKDQNRKRLEAERRNRLFRLKKPLQERLEEIEAELEESHRLLDSITARLADPATYQNGGTVQELQKAYQQGQQEIRRLTGEWEDFAARLEEIEREFETESN